MTSSRLISRSTTRSGLLLRDSLIFFALCGVTVALFILTYLLFRSFETHREDLGRTWTKRGEMALLQGHPAQAVTALRIALTYREDLPEQLLLAQALANAGHTEEAMNYFLNLRETRPGDGFINLQLARLTRREGDAQQAINYYRASIFGGWQGEGAQRRREVRLELAAYLAQRGNASAARDELLIAAGNTPETVSGNVLFGDRLAAIGYPVDAFNFYTKALEQKPHQRDVLAKAGRLAYTLGKYPEAYKLLTEAIQQRSGNPAELPDERQLAALAQDAHRLPELSLSRELPAVERAEHILLASRIAQARLQSCPAQPPASTAPTASAAPAASTAPTIAAPPVPALQSLRSRWAAATSQLNERSLKRDAALEDSVTQLINDTELQTVTPCGPPHGDDALLLMLASSPHP